MQELHTIRPNFLFKTTQDFNHTSHVAPQGPIVFINNIRFLFYFRCVLKTVMHVENYVKISRCVENVYVRHVENRVENCVEIRKNHHHTLQCMLTLSGRGPKIRRQTARFDSEFTRVSKVRHMELPFLDTESLGLPQLGLPLCETDLV